MTAAALGVLAGGCAHGGPAGPEASDPDHDLAMWELAFGGGQEGGPHPLRRIVAPRVSVRPSAEILEDENALEAHRTAAAAVTSATGGAVVFALGGAGIIVESAVDPAYQGACGAVLHFAQDGVTIVGGRVVCSSLYWAGRAPVLIHELLHVLGLDHSSVPGDVMCSCSTNPHRGISAREVRVIREVLRMRPGSPAPTTPTN